MTIAARPRIVPLEGQWEEAFADFLVAMRINGDEAFFHPHPLTREAASELVRYVGEDLYFLVVDGGVVLGYGMLRGWDEGYEVPSLGIALAPQARHTGLATALMHFLHYAARAHGARTIRLTVSSGNHAAVALYRRMGYRLEEQGQGNLLGTLDLTCD